MRKAALILVALLGLCSCRLYDKYTGEPFVSLEYTVDGERVEYEDWGAIYSNSFSPFSYVNLYRENNANGGEANLQFHVEHISLHLRNVANYFTDSTRYDFSSGDSGYFESQYGNISVTDGWYSLTTKSTEPYCTFEVHFEFTCDDGQVSYRITDGCARVGRRLQENINGLIKKSSQQ